MADIRLGYGVSERQQAPSSANYSRAVDVGPAAAEGRPPKSVPIKWRISARRSSTPGGRARHSQDSPVLERGSSGRRQTRSTLLARARAVASAPGLLGGQRSVWSITSR